MSSSCLRNILIITLDVLLLLPTPYTMTSHPQISRLSEIACIQMAGKSLSAELSEQVLTSVQCGVTNTVYPNMGIFTA